MSTPVHVPLVPCPVRFCFHFLVFLAAYLTNSLLFIMLLYLLLETDSASPSDISAMFAIEALAFLAVYVVVVAKQEIDLCCPAHRHNRPRVDVLSNPLIDV